MTKSKAPSQRQLRVGEEIRHALAEPLRRGDLRDPDLEGVSITVTEVRVSPDLKNATAFVLPLGGEGTEGLTKALGRTAPYLRSLIGRAVRLRATPRLTFQLDESFDVGARIDRLLDDERVQRDVAAAKRREAEDEDGA